MRGAAPSRDREGPEPPRRGRTVTKMLAILSHPRAYTLVQSVIGARRARARSVREYVRPQRGWRVLDIGCGPGYGVEWFAGAEYVGLDVNAAYIAHARRRYGRSGTFICQRFDEEIIGRVGLFDLVAMNGLLHHLCDEEATDIFRKIRRVLKPGGKIVTLDGCYTAAQSFVERKLLDHDRGRHVRDEQGYVRLVSGLFASVTAHVRRDLMFIPYTLLIMEIR